MKKCKGCEIEFEPKINRQKFHNISCYHRWFKREEFKKKKSDPLWMEKRRKAHRNWEAIHYKTPEGRLKIKEKIQRRKLSPKYYYTNSKFQAKKRGLHFNIDFNFFINNLWQKPCYYCGDLVKNGGMDRIDSSKGYYIGNVVPCCKRCNIMKLDHSTEAWISHIKKILRHLSNKKLNQEVYPWRISK